MTRTRLIQVVCLVIIAVAQARLAYANNWDIDCSMSCANTVRSFNCSFRDTDGPSSVCSFMDCIYQGQCCNTPAVAGLAMDEVCHQYQTSFGGTGYASVITGCGVEEEYASCNFGGGNFLRAYGTFYCSFTDMDCV